MRALIWLTTLVALGCSKQEGSGPPENRPKTGDVAATPADARPQQARPDDPKSPPSGPLRWSTDEKAALARAKEENKPVLIDFGADWCVPCKEYERRTFTDPAVVERLSKMVLLRFDVTEQTPADEAVQERYKATILPTLIVLSPGGTEALRIKKFLEPEPFLRELSRLE